MARLSAMVILVCVVALLCGCSATPQANPGQLPDDFALSVTVLPGSGMQPAWYIVEPDGTLRAALGERLPQSVRPPAVRTLSRSQVRQVWEVGTRAGLTNHAALTDRVSPVASSVPGAAAIVDVGAMGRRSTAAIPRDNEGLASLVQDLRALSWADQQPLSE